MKILRFFPILILSFSLTGCFDIFQHIFIDAEGNLQSRVRISIPGALFAIAQQNNGPENGEQDDPSTAMTENIPIEDYPEWMQATVESIRTEHNIGVDITFSGDPEKFQSAAFTEENRGFVPLLTENKLTIHLPEDLNHNNGEEAEEETDPQAEQMAMLFFSGSVYRLAIPIDFNGEIQSANLYTATDSHAAEIVDLNEVMILEFPLAPFLLSESEARIEVLFEN